MSLNPNSYNGLGTSLFGISSSNRVIDVEKLNLEDYYKQDRDLIERHIHGPREKGSNIKYQLIIILISAMIFVTAVAIYDIIRNTINYFYSDYSLRQNNGNNTEEEITIFLLANRNTIISSSIFALFCIITSLIFIPLLILLIRNK